MLFSCNAERVRAGVLWLFIGLLIVAAVSLSAVRFFLVAAPNLSERIEQRLSEQLGVPLEVDQIDATLSGLRPSLTLTGVTAGIGSEQIEVEQVTVSFAPWDSFRAKDWQLHALAVQGLQIEIDRNNAGRWSVSGLRSGGVEPRLRTLPVNRLLLTDSQVVVKDQILGVEQVFANAALRWRQQRDGEWRFALDSHTESQRLQAVLSIKETVGRALIRFEQLQLAPLFEGLNPQSRLDGQVWLTLDDAGVQTATAEVAGDQLGLLGGGLDSGAVSLRWLREPSGWRAAIWPERLQGRDGTTHALSPIVLGQPTSDAPVIGRIEQGSVGALGELLNAHVEQSAFVSGDFSEFEWAYYDASHWYATTQLNDVALSLEYAAFLKGPLAVDQVNGGVRLQSDGQAPAQQSLHFDELAARVEGTQASIDGHIEFANSASGVYVDLQADAKAAQMAMVRQHLPASIMDPRLVDWLNRALVDGVMTRASMRLEGSMQDFPFDQGQGEFTLRLAADDLTFRFNREWPAFENTNAELTFLGRELQIAASEGQIAGVSLQQATGGISNLWRPQLEVDLSLNGPAAAMLDVVKTAPLLPSADWLDQVVLDGEPTLDLALFFPFQRQPMQVDGRLRFTDGGLALSRPSLQVNGITGELSFDQDGVAWDELSGQIDDVKVTSQASTRGDGDAVVMEITAQGDLSLDQLPGMAMLADRANGTAQWQAEWVLPGFSVPRAEQATAMQMRIASPLEGIALDLPLGLSKTAGATKPTVYTLRLQRSGDQDVSLKVADQLQVLLNRKANGQRRAVVHFGALDGDRTHSSLSLPEAQGTTIGGQISSLRAADLGLLGSYQTDPEAEQTETLIPMPLQELAVAVDTLRVGRWQSGPFRLRAEGNSEDLFAELSGDIDGSVRYQQADGLPRVIARFARINAEAQPTLSPPKTAEEEQPESLLPLPKLDLTIDELRIAEASMGALDLTLEPIEGVSQGQLTLRGRAHDLSAQLVETLQENGASSEVKFTLATEDAGGFLQQMGFGPVLSKGQGDAAGEVSWAGRLWAPDLPSLAGQLSLDLADGSLPAVEPGPGRAIGLFSLSVLPRRLGLDFDDVVGAGLRFDQLAGNWQIDQGILSTEQFQLGGPSLDLTLTGTNNLVRREFDQQVVVVPRVSSTFALLGGFAGGPAAAALLFLTQGMLEPGISRLTRIEYAIQGPWAEPEFDLLDSDGVMESEQNEG